MDVAQTNIQLYNQLRRQGRPLDDLIAVRRAYEFMTTLYTGYFTRVGKPFVAHFVGVASILAFLEQPTELVTMGLLHSIYATADFGDGRRGGVTPSRRRVVRGAVGDRVEHLLARFPEVRVQWRTIDDARRALQQFDATERSLILVDLVDLLEQYTDLGVLYIVREDFFLDPMPGAGALIEIATEFGGPRLAQMLSASLAAAAFHRDDVPAELRSAAPPHLIVPPSCHRRVAVRVRLASRRLQERLRPLTRLQRLHRGVGRDGRTAG